MLAIGSYTDGGGDATRIDNLSVTIKSNDHYLIVYIEKFCCIVRNN